ncbi:hypothetical protein [uncultured Methanobrevibacter sp.]|uniref:hypothetical protein n=1 Tax=uncultured Methanobrevibacter sp. TaxID=253161 RepID=UPI0026027AE3|nr:hypothetical protein [uncultured Methanobrevibacter sp.]
MFDKDAIKKELIEGSNIILKRYDEDDIVESISVMNTKDHVIFLGSLKVFNEGNVKNIEKNLESCFDDYGIIKIRSKKVIPCCSMPYFHVSFHITVDNLI